MRTSYLVSFDETLQADGKLMQSFHYEIFPVPLNKFVHNLMWRSTISQEKLDQTVLRG